MIVPSRATAVELESLDGTHLPKLSVIRHAPNQLIPQGRGEPNALRPKGDRFRLYYPSAAYGNKNHLLLFKVLITLLQEGFDLELLLSGWDTEKFSGEIPIPFARAEEARIQFAEHAGILTERCILLGYCEYTTVEECYRTADLVVLPSLYEGFGLGLLEAAYRNRPVLCSDIEAFQEQVADCGVRNISMFRSDDPSDFADKLRTIVMSRNGSNCPPVVLETRSWKVVAAEYRSFLLSL